jgi:Dolichyl-phosphate-mannose-protein mannosyltransferase
VAVDEVLPADAASILRPRVASAQFGARWACLTHTDRVALVGLGAVLCAGFVLRVLFMAAWQPALMGYSDSAAYLSMASTGNLWSTGLHPAGYPVFLIDLHALVPTAWFVIGVQHLFGLASALLLWLAVRRAGVPRLAALLPAAVVALNGGEMFLEHSLLSESLFIMLTSVCIYAAARASEPPSARWAALAGFALGAADTVRVTALPLLPILVLWLLLGTGGHWRARLRAAGAGLACIVCVVGVYTAAQARQTGVTTLTTPAGVWNLYGRVAPFADCTKFTPPRGTAGLCQTTPPARRTNNVEQYLFAPVRSIALQRYSRGNGPASASQAQDAKISAFTWAVIEHQPLDYARTVLEGLIAYITPVHLEFANRIELGPGYDQFYHQILFTPKTAKIALTNGMQWYGVHSYGQNRAVLAFLLGYETKSRITGVLMGLLMLLSAFALFAPRGSARRFGIFLFVIAWLSLIIPPATHWWDARFAIPPLGPLSAAGALGAWQCTRLATRLARRAQRSRRTAATTI